jgi:hypothetical protein
MRKSTQALAAAALSAVFFATPATAASEREDLNFDAFVKMCDADNDGQVSKAEVMKTIEKMFDKHDKKRAGKLDKTQAEHFWRELMKSGGA